MKDRLSALLDGDLDEHAMGSVLETLRKDAALRQEWRSYCLIGDCLRGDRSGSTGFVERVMANLDQEPTVLAPAAAGSRTSSSSIWRSMLPIAASVAGVAAVGVIAATLYSGDSAPIHAPSTIAMQRLVGQPSTAAGEVEAAQQAARSTPPVDVGLREYVFAHQGIGGGGPMPSAVQYVRVVSDVERSGAR